MFSQGLSQTVSYLARVRKQETIPISRDEVEKGLSQLCAPPPRDTKTSTRACISDEGFQHITNFLKFLESHLKEKDWSSRPRTYTVLRNIGCSDLMPAFIALGLKDYSFPYSIEKLPDVLHDDSLKDKFMDAQKYVLTGATQLENGAEGVHVHTKRGEDLYHVVKNLGSGGYGSVDEVYSRLSCRRYARKQFMRKKNARDDQLLLRNFELEISSLKRLSHQHLVTMIGSYTDQRSVAYLMEPVAQCNLMTYLIQPHSSINARLPSLRSYFGCLASAVAYLHRQRIRHKDLKPQNVLIKNHDIYIADFGNALDWSKRGRDTTVESNTAFTEQYVAPEVAKRSTRNSASDVWSLGVVFLDMITVLRGSNVRELRKFLESHGTRHPYVWNNAQATNEWFEHLRQIKDMPETDNEPLMWIKDMTQLSPGNRPLAGALASQIRGAAALGYFVGTCCATDDDTEDYPSPPSSFHSGDGADFDQDGLPPELDLREKPFGSFVESSSQSSIERWLGVNPSPEHFISDSVLQPSHVFDGYIVDDPYVIVDDDTTQADTRSDKILSDDRSSTSRDLRTIDQCDGYDIVEEDSDDEKESERGGHGYEVLEDSSGSEATVRQHSAQTIAVSSFGDVTIDSAVVSDHNSDVSSFEAVQITQTQLDALPEDPIDVRLPNTSQETPQAPTEPGSLSAMNISPRNLQRRAGPSSRNAANASSQTSQTGTKPNVLNAENLGKLEGSVPSPDIQNNLSVQRVVARPKPEEPQISPSVYMQEVWEDASPAPTSIMSERTKKSLAGFGSGLAWQDKTANFLEKFAKAGRAAPVRELLNAGCNPGTKEKPRIRPLMLAVKGGSQRHNKCVVALLAAGANVNAREWYGRTALHSAIEHQNFRGYTNLIRDLLEAGADPNNKDNNGDAPLLQILYGGYEALEKHKRDALACLLRPEFDTNVNIMHQGTLNMPLHLAVRRRDPWAVSMILTRGARINEPNGSGMTPLMLAANGWSMKMSSNQNQVLNFLLQGGVNFNEQDKSGKTALHYAASHLCEGAVGLLLDKGADPKIRDNIGNLACHYAGESHSKIKKAPGAHTAIMRIMFDVMGYSFLSPIDGECAIVTAVSQSRMEDTELLLKHGAPLNRCYESRQDPPLLHIALQNQDSDMARVLIDKGAFVDVKNGLGQDAFGVCASIEQTKTIRSIIEYMKVHGKSMKRLDTVEHLI